MNFILKMALKSAAAGFAGMIRKELSQAESEMQAPLGAGKERTVIFRRLVAQRVGAAVEKMDPDKLETWAKSAANWLEKESGGGA